MTTRTAVIPRPAAWVATGCSTLLLTSCSEPPQIMDAWISSDGVTLEMAIDTCNANLTVDVDYTAAFVYVIVNAENDHTGDDCADGLTIVLEEPLGSRSLVDGTTGEFILPKPREGE